MLLLLRNHQSGDTPEPPEPVAPVRGSRPMRPKPRLTNVRTVRIQAAVADLGELTAHTSLRVEPDVTQELL